MDYKVGSLSDLITGGKTPNKKKVVRRQKLKKQTEILPDSNNIVEEVGNKVIKKNVKKNIKTKKVNVATESVGPTEKSPTKRKASTGDEKEPLQKKSRTTKNAVKRVPIRRKSFKTEQNPEEVARTVFVSNLPISSDTKDVKKLFAEYGKIETVHIRGVPVANPRIPKKVAFIKKYFHPQRKSFYGYIKFADRESAVKATEANGMIYEDHHLGVHLCDSKGKRDENKAIFVGNLSFYAEEDDLWQIFESCGPISSVRIVRDARTGVGKGFGYVNFENSDAVALALEMENVQLKDRELRINACNNNAPKKNPTKDKPKKIIKPGKPKPQKKIGKEESVDSAEGEQEDEEEENIKSENTVNLKKENKKPYQGASFMEKKKKRVNKGLLLKKKKIRQIAPKPKVA